MSRINFISWYIEIEDKLNKSREEKKTVKDFCKNNHNHYVVYTNIPYHNVAHYFIF